ncbi:MAG: GTP cyclohydrolase [Flavobacteriales bacterium]|nr:GTP cyclohydrolase [Flavobacteriales bacterium]
MQSINITEIHSKSELKKFISFAINLYKGNAYYVPPIVSDELKSFDSEENPAFEFCKVNYFLAYKNNKVVGRIATIINKKDEELLNDKKLRFAWFDFIEDIEVCSALLNKAEQVALENGIHKIEGPLGFTNLDKAGMLTVGFDQVATLIGLYNHKYYAEFLEKLNFKPNHHWIEFKLNFNGHLPDKVYRFADIVKQKFNLKVINFLDKKKSDLLNYADQILELVEETYKALPTFVPFTEKQKEYYKQKYFSVLSKDLIVCIADENNKLIAFSIVMYDYSKAFQKAKGKIFPFGWYHLLQASKNNDSVHFYLIGVLPEYQRKGVTSLIWLETYKIFMTKGIKHMETNPQLIENKPIQQLFKDYDYNIHKERKTFVKTF